MYFAELQKFSENDPFKFNEVIDIKDDLLDRYSDQVIDATTFRASGIIFANRGDVIVDTKIEGKLVVPSSRSLTPVDLPLDFSVEEYYVPSKAAESRYAKDDVVFVMKPDDQVDLRSTVIDNAILEIPMHILSPEEINGKKMPKGTEWEVLSVEDYNNQKAELKTVDPRLAKLKELLKDKDEKN